MKPFQVVDESSDAITYRYSPYYAWALYAVLLLLLASMFVENSVFYNATGIVAVVFIFLKVGLGWTESAVVRKAMKTGNVVVSGSKTSFSNPLTFVVKKDV